MSDLRKPFYDYAIGRDSTGRYGSFGGAWGFAEWARKFMPDATPARAFDAYVAAQTNALRAILGSNELACPP
jgi:hypothetical protein